MPTALETLKKILVARESQALNWFSSIIFRTSRFLTTVFIEFQKDMCLTIATALSLTSLLSLVPLMSVFFSIFAAFEAFERLKTNAEQWLFSTFIPRAELQQTISGYLHNYTQATMKMEIFNVVSLLVTTVLLFITIEHAMSVIWGIRRRRGYYESVKAFTSLLVLAPILLGCSTYFTALLSQALQRTEYFHGLATNVWTLLLFRHCVSWLLFFLGYVLIPYTRVNLYSALVGSFVASNAWEIAKKGFEVYLTRSLFHKTIYGQLSVIPIFLFWLYLSWVIFLFGAEFVYCHQYRRLLKYRRDAFDDENPPKAELAITLFAMLAREFRRGTGPVDLETLVRKLGLTPFLARDVFNRLEDKRLVCCVDREGMAYLPARSLDSVTLYDIYQAMEPVSFLDASEPRDHLLRSIKELLSELHEKQYSVLGDLIVGSVVNGVAHCAPSGTEAKDDKGPKDLLRANDAAEVDHTKSEDEEDCAD